jgi:hypothetical protein
MSIKPLPRISHRPQIRAWSGMYVGGHATVDAKQIKQRLKNSTLLHANCTAVV